MQDAPNDIASLLAIKFVSAGLVWSLKPICLLYYFNFSILENAIGQAELDKL